MTTPASSQTTHLTLDWAKRAITQAALELFREQVASQLQVARALKEYEQPELIPGLETQAREIKDVLAMLRTQVRTDDQVLPASVVSAIYRDEAGNEHTQPLSDFTEAGGLIDPDTGEDMPITGALVPRAGTELLAGVTPAQLEVLKSLHTPHINLSSDRQAYLEQTLTALEVKDDYQVRLYTIAPDGNYRYEDLNGFNQGWTAYDKNGTEISETVY